MDFCSLISQRMNLWLPQPMHGLKKCLSPADVAALRKQLKALKAIGVIKGNEEVKPSPLEPKVPINKQFRFCLDYQHFIQRTLPDQYNDHNIQMGLRCLIGNQYFSLLALDSRISQLPPFPGEREKPYSIRPLGFYEYERMQPGYCQSLAEYQKIMENVLCDMNMVDLLVHMDYIIVFAMTREGHASRLSNTLSCLAAEGFTILLENSFFNSNSVSYAGHVVCEGGIAIEDGKREVLSKWPKPRTASELQCYLDFCSYYRQFVTGFQDLAEPLYRLLRDVDDQKAKIRRGPWWIKESIEERWTKECEEAFHQLKNGLLHGKRLLPLANMTQHEEKPAKPPQKS